MNTSRHIHWVYNWNPTLNIVQMNIILQTTIDMCRELHIMQLTRYYARNSHTLEHDELNKDNVYCSTTDSHIHCSTMSESLHWWKHTSNYLPQSDLVFQVSCTQSDTPQQMKSHDICCCMSVYPVIWRCHPMAVHFFRLWTSQGSTFSRHMYM